MRRLRIVGFLLAKFSIVLGMTLPSTANAASPVLAAGVYHYSFSSYSFCRVQLAKTAPAPDFGSGSFAYAGSGKSGSTMTYTNASASTLGGTLSTNNTVQILNLPLVPLAGPSNWSGAYKGQIYTYQSSEAIAGKASTTAISGTITISLTAFTANTFYGTVTFAPKGLASCATQIVGGP